MNDEDERRREIRTDLARRMGYSVLRVGVPNHWHYQLQLPDKSEYQRWRRTEKEAWMDAPDFVTNAADNRALVKWLAEDDARWKEFKQELLSDWVSSPEQDVVRFVLTAPLKTIAEAALTSAWRAIQNELSAY